MLLRSCFAFKMNSRISSITSYKNHYCSFFYMLRFNGNKDAIFWKIAKITPFWVFSTHPWKKFSMLSFALNLLEKWFCFWKNIQDAESIIADFVTLRGRKCCVKFFWPIYMWCKTYECSKTNGRYSLAWLLLYRRCWCGDRN